MSHQQKLSNHIALIIQLRKYLTVAHHVKGRIRFRINPAIFNELKQLDSLQLDDILTQIPGIKDIRINKIAGSLVVSYSPKELHPTWWKSLLQANAQEADVLLRKVLLRSPDAQENQ